MFVWLNLLVLLCLVYYSRLSSNPVRGEIGGNATLKCELEADKIFQIDLSRQAKNMPVCQEKNCSGRVFQEGSCDVIIKDLIFSDAGKYILRVHYNPTQTEVDRQTLEYHLHIHDEISVKIGMPLQLDVLLTNADKVEKNSSGECKKVWTKGHGVWINRLTDRDGNLTFINFTSTDSGTYRVLDSEGETLITVTVTAPNTGSEEKLDTDQDKTKAVESWIIVPSVIGPLVVLGLSAVIWIYKCQKRKPGHEDIPMEEREQQNI